MQRAFERQSCRLAGASCCRGYQALRSPPICATPYSSGCPLQRLFACHFSQSPRFPPRCSTMTIYCTVSTSDPTAAAATETSSCHHSPLSCPACIAQSAPCHAQPAQHSQPQSPTVAVEIMITLHKHFEELCTLMLQRQLQSPQSTPFKVSLCSTPNMQCTAGVWCPWQPSIRYATAAATAEHRAISKAPCHGQLPQQTG
jgi:hypothetical protein